MWPVSSISVPPSIVRPLPGVPVPLALPLPVRDVYSGGGTATPGAAVPAGTVVPLGVVMGAVLGALPGGAGGLWGAIAPWP